MAARLKANAGFILLCALLAAVILVIDLSLPLGVAGGVPYIVLVLIALRLSKPYTFLFALVGTALTVIGFFFSPPGGHLWQVILNRFLAIFAIWVTAILSLQHLRAERLKERGDRVQEALYLSQTRNQALIEAIPDLILCISRDGTFLDFEPATEFETYVPPTQFLGAKIDEVLPAEVASPILECVEQAQQTGEIQRLEYQLPINGRLCDYEARYVAAGADEVLVIVRDITGRKQAEKRLHSYTTRLEVLHQIDQAILAARSPAEIANVAINQLNLLIPCWRISVLIFDVEGNYATVLAILFEGQTRIDVGERVPLDSISFSADYRQGEFTLIDDIRTLSPLPPHLQTLLAEGMLSGLVVPLLARDDLIGTLNLGADRPNAFRAEHVRIAREVADSLAIAIQQSRLHQQVERHTEELEQRVAARTAELARTNSRLWQEIAGRQRVEEALRKQQQEFRSLAENLPDIVARFDRELRHIYVNQRVETSTGLSAQDFIGKTNRELDMPDDLIEFWDEALLKVLRSGRPQTIEFTFPRPNGPEFFEARLIPESGANGSVETILGISRNITERKLTVAALEESQRRLQALFDNALDAILLADDEGRYVDANPAACALLGYSREELLQQSAWSLTPGSNRETGRELWQAFIAGGKQSGEYPLLRRDGTIIETEYQAVANIVPGLHLSVLRDITGRKQAEEKIRRRTKQLETLRQVSLELTTELDLETLLESIVSRAVDLLGGTVGDLYLYRPEKEALECAVIIGTPQEPIGTLLRRGEGLSGKVWASGEPLIVDNYQQWSGRSPTFEDYPITAMVGVPVRWGQQFLGVLNVANAADPFSPADAELLSLLAGQAAAAIRNARLVRSLRESEGRLRSLFEDSPISQWLEDWSEIKRYFDRLQQEGITDLRSYLEQNPEAVTRCAEMVKIIDVNQATVEMYEAQSKEDFWGGLSQVLRAESYESYQEELLAIAAGKTNYECEEINQTLQGKKIYIALRWSVAPGHEKTFSKILVSAIDITERVRAEKALRISEERYALAVSAGQVGVWAWDLMTDEFYIAPNLKTMLGYEDHKIRNHIDDWRELIHPDDLDRVMKNLEAHLAGKTSQYEIEHRMRHRDGTIRWFLARGTTVHDGHDRPSYLMGTDTDITERKQAEQTLEQRNRELGLLNRVNQAFISSRDLDQVLTTVLEEMRHLLGVVACSAWLIDPETDELVCRQVTDPQSEIVRGWRLEPGVGLAGLTAQSGQSLNVPDVRADERHFKGVDQQTGLALRSILTVPLRVKETVIGVLQVVDEMVDRFNERDQALLESLAATAAIAIENARLYEQVQRYAGELEILVEQRTARLRELERQRTESEKLAASGRIAARIAHEINNPLAGIKNSFLLIKEAVPGDHPYFDYVGRIEKEIERIARIVRQMFELYRPDQESAREFLVDEAIRDIAALLEIGRPERDVAIKVDTGPGSMVAVMSEGLLRQVLYNIIQNAIEASPPRGLVKIRARVAEGFLTIEISDQGPGIPDQVRAQIFEPFFTTKTDLSRPGLGLGLSVSRSTVEAMRGTLDFESEAGQGTIFWIVLPLRPPERKQPNE